MNQLLVENNVASKSNIYNKLYTFVFVLTIIHLIFFPFGNKLLLNIIRIPALFAIFAVLLKKLSGGTVNKIYFIFFLFVLIPIIINLLDIGFLNIDIDTIISIISIISYLGLVATSDEILINKKLLNLLYFGSIFLSLVFIIYSFMPFAYSTDEGHYSPFLTLGMHNSNAAGVYIFLVYSLIIITLQSRRNKIVPVILALCLLYLIYLTNSRAVFVASILLPVISLVRHRKLPNLVILIACLIPFLFVPAYLALNEVMDNIDIMGKTLFSGRQETFIKYIESIHYPYQVVFGSFRTFIFQNAHNGPLAIFVSIGTIGILGFYGTFLYTLLKSNNSATSQTATYAIIVILTCFIHSCGEAVLFLGGFPGLTFMYTFFILSHSK